MDSQEGIDKVYTLDYFDRTKLTEILIVKVKTCTKPVPGQESVNSFGADTTSPPLSLANTTNLS